MKKKDDWEKRKKRKKRQFTTKIQMPNTPT